MRRIVFLGNRQAAMLADTFSALVAPWTGEHASYIAGTPPFSEADTATVEAATLVVVQQSGTAPPGFLGDLPEKAERHVFPALAAPFLWPFAGVPHPINRPYPYLQAGPYPGAMGDVFLNRLIGHGVDADEAVRRYLALDMQSVVDLDALLAQSLERQRQRDEATGYAFTAAIAQDFREQRLFETPDDPARMLGRTLALAVMQRLGADAEALARIEAHFPVADDLPQALPIHPVVARHFGLRFWAEDARYPFLAEGSFTFAEFAQRYMRGTWSAALQDGIAQIRAGQLDSGIPKLEGALRHAPRSAYGRAMLASGLGEQGRLDDAIAQAEAAIERDPLHAAAFGILASLLRRKGRLPEAEDAVRRAIALSPCADALDQELSRILLRQGRIAEAAAAAARVAALNPRRAAPQVHLAYLLLQADRLEEAEAALRQAVALTPRSASLHGDLSHVLARRGDLAGAVAAARRAVELNPTEVPLRTRLASVLAQAGLGAEAAAERARVVEVTTASASPRTARRGGGDEPESLAEQIEALRQETKTAPRNASLRSRLANLLLRAGQPDAAEAELRRALELTSDNAGLFENLSRVLTQQGRVPEAIDALREAVELNPLHAPLYAALAHLLMRAERLAEAEAAARRAVELAPESALFHDALSRLQVQQGKPEDALATARHAVALNPRGAPMRAHLGAVLLRLQQPTAAEAEIRMAIDLAPHAPVFRMDLIHFLGRVERPADALAVAEDAVARHPEHGPLRTLLAQLQARQGAATEPPEPARHGSATTRRRRPA